MFKRLPLCAVVFFFFAQLANAQPIPYSFLTSIEPYVPLTGATAINPTTLWDNFEYVPVPLGFTFEGGGTNYTQLYVGGYDGALFSNDLNTLGTVLPFSIFGYNTYIWLGYKPGTEVRYRTDGQAPGRIFKLEWYKSGFDGLPGEVSFQIWLYEGSNAVQIRLGPQQVAEPVETFYNEVSPLIGIMEDFDGDQGIMEAGQWVVGPVNTPTDSVVLNWLLPDDVDGPLFGTTDLPVDGRVYSFGLGVSASLTPARAEPLAVFPNPVHDRLHFSVPATEPAVLQLYDAAGRLAWTTELPAGAVTAELPNGLAPGAYVLQRQTNTTRAQARVIVF